MDGLVGVDSFPESAWKPRRNVSTTCPKKKPPFPAGTAGVTPVPTPTPLPSPSSTPVMERGETAPKLCQKKNKKTSPSSAPGLILNVCVWQAPAG